MHVYICYHDRFGFDCGLRIKNIILKFNSIVCLTFWVGTCGPVHKPQAIDATKRWPHRSKMNWMVTPKWLIYAQAVFNMNNKYWNTSFEVSNESFFFSQITTTTIAKEKKKKNMTKSAFNLNMFAHLQAIHILGVRVAVICTFQFA